MPSNGKDTKGQAASQASGRGGRTTLHRSTPTYLRNRTSEESMNRTTASGVFHRSTSSNRTTAVASGVSHRSASSNRTTAVASGVSHRSELSNRTTAVASGVSHRSASSNRTTAVASGVSNRSASSNRTPPTSTRHSPASRSNIRSLRVRPTVATTILPRTRSIIPRVPNERVGLRRTARNPNGPVLPRDQQTQSLTPPISHNSSQNMTPRMRPLECPICFQPLVEKMGTSVDVMSTLCGHLFCMSCLLQAYSLSKCCPVCRLSIDFKDFRKIHL